jgi:hypothetical protein
MHHAAGTSQMLISLRWAFALHPRLGREALIVNDLIGWMKG